MAVNGLVLDQRTRQVQVGDRRVQLSPTEYTLLRLFMLNPDRAISKKEIFATVWGYDFNGNANVIQTYVSYLRRKLGRQHGSMLRTVRGVGYELRRHYCPAGTADEEAPRGCVAGEQVRDRGVPLLQAAVAR